MLEVAQEAVNKEGWNKREPTGATGKQEQQIKRESG
jgi:hypothetical protein